MFAFLEIQVAHEAFFLSTKARLACLYKAFLFCHEFLPLFVRLFLPFSLPSLLHRQCNSPLSLLSRVGVLLCGIYAQDGRKRTGTACLHFITTFLHDISSWPVRPLSRCSEEDDSDIQFPRLVPWAETAELTFSFFGPHAIDVLFPTFQSASVFCSRRL